MSPRLLVATSVHPPDDPRIREKLIRSLESDFDIAYATKEPGPTDVSGIEWIPLAGSRRERRRSVRRLLRHDPYDVAVVHDPELLPGAISAAKRGRSVVFDVHEDLPAQMLTKRRIPRFLRPAASAAAGWYLRRAEARLPMTLAEEGYASLFEREHVVFPNYPNLGSLPEPAGAADGPIAYVGDITRIRGAETLVDAVARMQHPRSIVFVGRCSDELADRLQERASDVGVAIELVGWRPHRAAMRILQEASVGVSPLHDVPNYRDSLPTKTLEYLALGLPVVASDLSGTRRVIGDLPGVVLVEPGDASALATGLDRSLSDITLRRKAQDGAAVVRDTFSWPTESVRAFYRSLAASQPTPEQEA